MEFEKQFAAYVGCKHALAVNSCTAALQLALDAIGLQPGDEVLLPSYTFTATAEVVTYFGARPVLCDSVPGGFNIDPADAERRVTAKTRAIIPVHIAGEACDLDPLHAMARRHGLHVIEDAAHTLPAWYRGRKIGTISEMTAFSFYATKTITTGEGGMLATDNDQYARAGEDDAPARHRGRCLEAILESRILVLRSPSRRLQNEPAGPAGGGGSGAVEEGRLLLEETRSDCGLLSREVFADRGSAAAGMRGRLPASTPGTCSFCACGRSC